MHARTLARRLRQSHSQGHSQGHSHSHGHGHGHGHSHSHSHSHSRHGDRGSVSLWVVIFAFVTLALLILIVDGGQVIVAKSRAADIAEQAARAAADDIDPAALRNGRVEIAAGACGVPGPASDLVSTYQKGVGVTATMLKCQPGTGPQGAPDVTVRVQVSMTPFIPVRPFGTITVSAAETAFLACGTANARVAC